ncbi:DUF2267 domain-containing protein [Gracilimonas sp. Q87]|uniref:DUF2267 domain-containing protein n=1 Tax=Gracilimonas sp. Q87 TaxID=3384766 RepID=UPI0039845500
METKEIAQLLVERTEIKSEERAKEIIIAFLKTLGERVSKTEQENFADQLPTDLADLVLADTSTERYTLDAFYKRFGSRCDLKVDDSIKYTQECGQIAKEFISVGKIADILKELPNEYEEIFA